MTPFAPDLASLFRRLHKPGDPLLLANAWDAGSARIIEASGARAIATTSAGVAWAHGYPDGDALPPAILARTVAEMTRVVSVPVSVDIEGGYSTDPVRVGEIVRAVLDAGAVGVNVEDGTREPALLAAKIGAARAAANAAGAEIFINARTDVYLAQLVPLDQALAETQRRAAIYRDAGADGLFVPCITASDHIRVIVSTAQLPVNVLVVPKLPPFVALQELGVARISMGSALAQAALRLTASTATTFLAAGEFEIATEPSLQQLDINALMSEATRDVEPGPVESA